MLQMDETEAAVVGEVMAYEKDEPPIVGVVLSAVEDELGRTTHLIMQAKDTTTRTGRIEDFREATDQESQEYAQASLAL